MADFSLDEIIEMAIQIEKSGYVFYDNALRKKKLSGKAKELLQKLRDEEKQHEKIFSTLFAKKDLEMINYGSDQELVNDYLRAIVNYRFFTNPDSAIKSVEQAKDEKEIVMSAINFEKDTLLYFQGIKDIIKDSHSKDVLEKIIKEEISHILWLTIHRDKITG